MASAPSTSFVRAGILANITRNIFIVKGQSARETIHELLEHGPGKKEREIKKSQCDYRQRER